MADYKQLCADLVNELHGYKVAHPNHDTDLIDRARAELAKPEPEGPTDKKLLHVFYTACLSGGGMADEIHLRGLRAVLRAVADQVVPQELPSSGGMRPGGTGALTLDEAQKFQRSSTRRHLLAIAGELKAQ